MNARHRFRGYRAAAFVALLCGIPAITAGAAVPLAVGSCDDFEDGMDNWSVNATSGFSGINDATSSSPSNSLYLNGGIVEVESMLVDTSTVSFSNLSVWVRRGWDTFSEDPDPGEDLVIEYLDDLGNWVALETFTGHSRRGQIFLASYNLPANGRHAGFRLRFRMLDGDGAGRDYWHIDDVCFNRAIVPELLVSKIARTVDDPVNGAANPKAIPGATVRYTVSVSNHGSGTVDSDSIVITDPIPADATLFVDTSGGDPVTFVDGPVTSGLDFSYATDVTFSRQADGGPPFNYNPNPDAQGFDPVVTGIRINPTGVMNATTGGDMPSFNIHWQVRID